MSRSNTKSPLDTAHSTSGAQAKVAASQALWFPASKPFADAYSQSLVRGSLLDQELHLKTVYGTDLLLPSLAEDYAKISNAQNSDLVQAQDTMHKLIEERMSKAFKGRDLEILVAELLKVQGFAVQVSPVGPDGGVDVLASSQSIGLGGLKICVQVKSSVNPIGQDVFLQLKGVMHKFNADYALLVAWGGFNVTVENMRAQNFFSVRLWDKHDIIRYFLQSYEQLPPEIQSKVPLRRIYVPRSSA